MPSDELKAVLDYIQQERGVNRAELVDAVKSALSTASKKTIKDLVEPRIEIDEETFDIKVFSQVTVVESVKGPNQITIEDALAFKKDAQVNDLIEVETTPEDFGRISAQTAKHVIIQKIREAEKGVVLKEYQDKKGEIVSGVIRRREGNLVFVDLGKTEALLPPREQCPHENYPDNARIRAYVVDVRNGVRGPEVILSRTHPALVQKLFELEVPEISEGVVVIKAVAREPGFRTKIAVASNNDKVDSVGACVGMRGERIKNIVHDLSGEKIDVIRWDSDPAKFIQNALSPAKIKTMDLHPDENKVEITVDQDQLSLAIGKKGQNARLCSRLTGWRIDINKDLGDLLKKNENITKQSPSITPVIDSNESEDIVKE